MTVPDLAGLCRGYIACLNAQDWARLGAFVGDAVRHNGRPVGLAGYRAMLERDFREIPDLHFDIHLLVAEPPFVASRLDFRCTPRGMFFDLPINGRVVAFSENVFYRFENERIEEVWSVIDKAAIEAQLAGGNKV